MNKYFTRILLSTFVIISIFISGISGPTVAIAAQSILVPSMSSCQLVTLLISVGAIPSNQAAVAWAIFGCLPSQQVTPPPTTTPVSAPAETTPANSYPTVTLGQAVDPLPCATTNINLAWTPPTGSVSSDVRVNDETINAWGGKTGGSGYCQGYDGDGDLCRNGLPVTPSSLVYPVSAGHFYHYWVDFADSTGTATSSQNMDFSVASCQANLTPSLTDTIPTVTLSQTSSVLATTTCGVSSVNLAWTTPTTPAGIVYHNIRVNDTINGWTTQGWCASNIAPGDLCENSFRSNLRAGFPVTPGHTYNFWVDSTDVTGAASTTRAMNFQVPVCAASPTVALKMATTTATGTYVDGPVTVASGTPAWLQWTSTNATACTRIADPTTTTWTGSAATSSTAVSLGAITANHTYSITCTGPGGSKTDSVVVSLIISPQPTVNLQISTSDTGSGAASSLSVSSGAPAWLKWSTTNATTCTKSASPATSTWAGVAATSSAAVSIGTMTASRTYTLSCTGVGGTKTDDVNVTVTAPVVANSTFCTFDPVKYANAYPDLKAAFGYDATALKNHWLVNGIAEGRTPCGADMPSCKFVATTYVSLYPDLVAANVDGLSHYKNYGLNEGRGICKIN